MPKSVVNALTPLQVRSALPGRYSDGGGLQLLVKASGSRSWVYRFSFGQRIRELGLGPASGPGAIKLAEAREAAFEMRRLVKAGVDPIEQKQRAAADAAAAAQAERIAGITFRQSAEAYIAAHERGWRNPKHRQQWRNTLATYVYPVIGDLPVADVGTAHVMTILEPIWHGKPETASRVRGRIEVILDAAKVMGHRVAENPARWRGQVEHVLPARSRLSRGHHTALPFPEVPAFMKQLRERDALTARALEFVILTASRSGEVLGARWDEFDLDKALWTIPAERMKAGKAHRVPLSAAALSLLAGLKAEEGKYVFASPSGGKLSVTAMSQLLKRMQMPVTVHGFRSSFRDWASETQQFANEVAEMALAHAIPNKAEAAYRRDDLLPKRRLLMDSWALHCSRPNDVKGKVTPLRRKMLP